MKAEYSDISKSALPQEWNDAYISIFPTCATLSNALLERMNVPAYYVDNPKEVSLYRDSHTGIFGFRISKVKDPAKCRIPLRFYSGSIHLNSIQLIQFIKKELNIKGYDTVYHILPISFCSDMALFSTSAIDESYDIRSMEPVDIKSSVLSEKDMYLNVYKNKITYSLAFIRRFGCGLVLQLGKDTNGNVTLESAASTKNQAKTCITIKSKGPNYVSGPEDAKIFLAFTGLEEPENYIRIPVKESKQFYAVLDLGKANICEKQTVEQESSKSVLVPENSRQETPVVVIEPPTLSKTVQKGLEYDIKMTVCGKHTAKGEFADKSGHLIITGTNIQSNVSIKNDIVSDELLRNLIAEAIKRFSQF